MGKIRLTYDNTEIVRPMRRRPFKSVVTGHVTPRSRPNGFLNSG